MANSSNERFTKTEGILNSCQINVIIPALIHQLGEISNDKARDRRFDGEYHKLLTHFNTHFGTNLNLKQLHNFLASKSYFEQQFILDAVLRQYMFENFKEDQVEYNDEITQLTTWEAYRDKDDSVYHGKYPMMPYNEAINYLFNPLGFNLRINDLDADLASYVERNLGPLDQELDPISTIEIYGSGDHYNLAPNVEEDQLPANNIYKKAYDDLLSAVENSGAQLGLEDKFDEPNFNLIRDYVNHILERLKDDTTQELAIFLSHEADEELDLPVEAPIDLTKHGYTDEEITELNRIFSSCINLVYQTLALQLNPGAPVSEDEYFGKNKSQTEELDHLLATQLQAEEIEEFRASFSR